MGECIAKLVLAEDAGSCTKFGDHKTVFDVVLADAGQFGEAVTIREVQRSLDVLDSLVERQGMPTSVIVCKQLNRIVWFTKGEGQHRANNRRTYEFTELKEATVAF